MRELYDEAKESIQNKGGISRQNTIDLVNTIIRRKRLYITLKQLTIGLIPCLRNCFRNDKTINRNQQIFDKAQKMLNKQFDVTSLLRMVNLT